MSTRLIDGLWPCYAVKGYKISKGYVLVSYYLYGVMLNARDCITKNYFEVHCNGHCSAMPCNAMPCNAMQCQWPFCMNPLFLDPLFRPPFSALLENRNFHLHQKTTKNLCLYFFPRNKALVIYDRLLHSRVALVGCSARSLINRD